MICLSFLIIFFVYFLSCNKRYRWFYIIYKTLGRDLRILTQVIRIKLDQWKCDTNRKTVAKIFTEIALKHPMRVAFYCEDEIWTFDKVEKFSNKIAHFFKSEGYKIGDTIAFLLDSKPEYVCVWLGLAKIGVITALINTNLVTDPLLHSIKVSGAKAVIYGDSFAKAIGEILDKLSNTGLYQISDKDKNEILGTATDLRKRIETQSDRSPTADIEDGVPSDKLMFVYTSGTTGLPKAAVITNMRYIFMTLTVGSMIKLTSDDIIYNPLPLYHTAGGILGVGQSLLKGVPVVIKKKFSATNFWIDCIKYRCTTAQYIGEMCRYLLIAHGNTNEPIEHPVKKMYGNGLKPPIWKKFISKFGVKAMYEIYGATEGNTGLINIDNTVGAVGCLPRWASLFYPITLVKCDEATGDPIRGPNGFCQRCQPGEPGIIIGKIIAKKSLNEFSGYLDKSATEKKIVKNVFKNDDQYFNSGDILVQDELGYFYFKDRIGDTFRWKGENVSTAEIEILISNLLDFNDAVVYGVQIPGSEGRAGMLAIVDSTNNLDMKKLSTTLKNNLPSYAIPLFVRIINSIPMTGTYKLQKRDLQREGFDVEKIKDPLFLYNDKNVTYAPLTRDKYDDIMSGKIKL